MARFALSNLIRRRGRTALTALAVFAGVSLICGTLVFTDTIRAAFRQQFTTATSGAAVIVSSRQDPSSAIGAPATIPSSLIARIARLPNVGAAQGQVQDVATIVGRNGRTISSTGQPTLALSYLPPPFTGLMFASGVRPRGLDQVAIDEGTAEREHYRVGDRVMILTGAPARAYTIAGIFRYGSAALGGAATALFDLGTAQSLYGKERQADLVYVSAVRGTSPPALVREIRPLLGSQLVARTTPTQVDTDLKRVTSQLSLLIGGLLAFGLIAVAIGALAILSTFSVTVARRTRELALLRALGATRNQVLLAVVAEAAAIGLVAALAGLLGGLAVTAVVRAVLSGTGYHLPSGGPVLAARTVLVAVAVGVLATIAAAVWPALRATRLAPLQALRGGDPPPGSHDRWRRALPLSAALALGVAGLVLAVATGGSSSARLTGAAAGAVMLLVAIAALVPTIVGRMSGLVSQPLQRRGGLVVELARENVARNPTRTAGAAAGLMIGLALVLFVTVYANGIRASTGQIVGRTVLGDYAIESQDGSSLIPSASVRVAAATPGVVAVSTLKKADAQIGGSGSVAALGIDPTTFGDVYKFDWIDGTRATLTALTNGEALVERDTARAAGLRVGDRTTVTAGTGARAAVTVAGIYRDQALLRGFVLPLSEFNQIFDEQRLAAVFVKLGPGANRAAAGAALRQGLHEFPGVVARSQQQLRDQVAGRANGVRLLFYALLALTVLLAVLGIVNTLTLSLYERTHELGLLRAVGLTPDQARAMIRAEGVITAAIGTIVGVVLGLALAWIITRPLTDEGISFAVPWLQVVALLAIGVAVGALAALGPAARAARLDVLSAIAYE